MESDKGYWHGYLPFYEEKVFRYLDFFSSPLNIFEFGVSEGASIEYFAKRFPTALIYGGDILKQNPLWPKSDLIRYEMIDQGNRHEMQNMFSRLCTNFDLIIDDGSHFPEDQVKCLLESMTWITMGGFYILEDIHTSVQLMRGKVNAFHVLLAFEHLKSRDQGLSLSVARDLSTNSFFNSVDLYFLFKSISQIQLYRRTLLPSKCYRCKSSEYNYSNLTCSCGVELYGTDSMSFIIRK